MLEKLKDLLDRKPFVSFRIVVTSGSVYEVISPYQIAIGQTQLDYYFPRSNRSATIRLNQLVSLETLHQPQSALPL